MKTIQKTEYGTYEIGLGFGILHDIQKVVHRTDIYRSNSEPNSKSYQLTRVLDENDFSGVFCGDRTLDNMAKCYYCYTSAAHSEKYHENKISS